jgi:hypothetical protein
MGQKPSRRLVIIAALAAAACGGASGKGEGPWEFHAGGGPSGASWLRSVGQEGPPGEPQARSTILSLDCRPDHRGATILTEQALRQGSTEVELALDGGPPSRISGFAGTTETGGQVVLTASLDSVLELLSGHRQATIGYADGAGSSRTTAVFPITGLEGYRERFLAACGLEVGAR